MTRIAVCRRCAAVLVLLAGESHKATPCRRCGGRLRRQTQRERIEANKEIKSIRLLKGGVL